MGIPSFEKNTKELGGFFSGIKLYLKEREKVALIVFLGCWFLMFYFLRFFLTGVAMIPDDSFYYLKTASNVWEYGYPTFDGITATNGFHPLWFVICMLVAFPLRGLADPNFYVGVVIVINIGISVYAAVLVYELLCAYLSRQLSLIVSFVSFSCCPMVLVNAMESSISLLLFCLCLVYIRRVWEGEVTFNPFRFGVLSLLILLARLDNGLLLIILYLALTPRIGLRNLFISGVLMTVLSIPYFSLNYYFFDHLMPISGTIKSFWRDLFELDWAGHKLNGLFQKIFGYFSEPLFIRNVMMKAEVLQDLFSGFVNAVSFGNIPTVSGRRESFQPLYVSFPLLLFSGVGLALMIRKWGSRQKRENFSRSIVIVLLGVPNVFFVFQLFYYWTSIGCPLAPWYFGISMLSVFVTISIVLFYWIESLKRGSRIVISNLFVVLLFLFLSSKIVPETLVKKQNPNIAMAKTIHASHLKELTNEDDNIGSWAAGFLGYYADRKVVNLEGLIAGKRVSQYNRNLDMGRLFLELDIKYITEWWTEPIFEFSKPRPEGFDSIPVSQVRRRALFDYWPALTLVRKISENTGRYTGWIWSVDQDSLRSQIEYKERLVGRIELLSSILPAEQIKEMEKGRVSVSPINAFHSAVASLEVKYFVPVYYEEVSKIKIFARVYNATVTNTVRSIEISLLDSNMNSTFDGRIPGWQVVEFPVVEFSGQPEFITKSQDTRIYIDEYYFVLEENLNDFRGILTENSAFNWGSALVIPYKNK